ncbi:translation initiation factor IF-3-like [Tubulanus polymorphus]|uniref:translation initiation factor IF-3-like n=1 Tax=Tubulanus polymorphus TaxID=672921 RepID=UPI003DA2E138
MFGIIQTAVARFCHFGPRTHFITKQIFNSSVGLEYQYQKFMQVSKVTENLVKSLEIGDYLGLIQRKTFVTSVVRTKLKQPDDDLNREVEATIAIDKLNKQKIKLLGNSNQDLGVMTLNVAKKKASVDNLKVVLIDSNVDPPVYQLKTGRELHLMRVEKQQQQSKYKNVEKSMKVKSSISAHDLQLKIAQFTGWLEKGYSIKVNIKASRRKRISEEQEGEVMMTELDTVFKSFSNSVAEIAVVKEVLRTENELKLYAKPCDISIIGSES